MGNTKRISISNAPKSLKITVILLPLIGFIFIPLQLDNDFYFLYPTGEYIINNGFPVKDILSMHGNMDIVVQQWLIDAVFYGLYSKLGAFGIFGFIYLCYAAFAVLMYKFCKTVCNNYFTAGVIAFIADMIAANIYMRSRPHALSFVLFLFELYSLEKYVKTKSVKWLAIIPLISLLLINAHASMWLLLFIFALPYAAQALPLKFKKIKQEPCCSFPALLITGIISFAAGFINPYGIKAMTYVFTSFGNSEINSMIYEMYPPKPTDAFGLMFYCPLLICIIIIAVTRYKNFQLRFILLFTGTMALGFMTGKSVPLFLFCGFPVFSYYLKDLDFSLPVRENEKPRTVKQKLLLAIPCVLIIGSVLVLASLSTNHDYKNNSGMHDYESLDAAVEILDREAGDIVLFAGFNQGQYLEFKGYHPYIDGRAELFLKENNHEFDYFGEYIAIVYGDLNYKDFVNKYGFTHLIVSVFEPEMYKGIKNDNDYEAIYKGNTFTLFRLKEQNKLDND